MGQNVIVVSHNISDGFLADVLCAAIEGGINYWAGLDSWKHKGPPCDQYADIGDMVEGEELDGQEPKYRVTIDTILAGIKKITSGEVKLRKDIHETIASAIAENYAGQIDAEVADCIVQAGLFGEVRYG